MRRFALSGLIAVSALTVLLAGGATDTPANEPSVLAYEFTMVSTIDGVPAAALPHDGECRIWYNGVSVERQPHIMDCEHAKWIAQSWGGRVIETNGTTATVIANIDGRNDFTGVPSEALPDPGYFRAWVEGLAPEQQPAQSDCVVARRTARAEGGRVLFMPL